MYFIHSRLYLLTPYPSLFSLVASLNLSVPPSFFFFFLLFRAAPVAYGGSQLGVESELHLTAYATDTAMQDPSHICDLHHSSQQRRIVNPLSARDGTLHLIVPSRIRLR